MDDVCASDPITEAASRVRPKPGIPALAKRLGVTAQAVYKWKKAGIPAERVLDIERESGVSRHELRPDLYPVEKQNGGGSEIRARPG